MKELKRQQIELDFEKLIRAWETKEITRDQLTEYLNQLGFDSEFVIENLEYEEH